MISFSRARFACCCLAVSLIPLGSFAQQKPISSPDLRASASLPHQPDVVSRPPITPELRGDIYMARKMYREAIDTYRESPDSPVIANKIGIAFHQLLLLDLAKKNYELAIKLDSKYPEAINNLGTIYYAQKNYRKAIRCYDRALKYSPPSASIYANLGAAYFGRKDYKHATSYYEQALTLDPDVFEHHSGFGTMMQERTVEERATFHLYLAKMYAKQGAKDRALIYLRKALEEGVKDRKKIPDMPEFVTLKTDPAFKQLIAENPRPL
ncbi:MAG TPA: tetratricopeptide repeat protein [Bryobacteraceae bacterium]|nr:tetratricopeptide repeat protein [Bryobacteraceae bacterium]